MELTLIDATWSACSCGATIRARADTRSQPRSIVNGSSSTRAIPIARNRSADHNAARWSDADPVRRGPIAVSSRT